MTRKFLARKNLSFVIPGRPLAKGGDRQGPTYGTGKAFEAIVRMLAKTAMFEQGWEYETGPIYIAVTINVHPPKQHVRKADRLAMERNQILPLRRPDVDSLGKKVCRAIMGTVYEKAQQVIGFTVVKRYTKKDECIEVLVGTADTWRVLNNDLRNA